MKINANNQLESEAGEDFNIQFKPSPHVSGPQQVAERILIIHAPGSRDLDSAVRDASFGGRSTHLIIGTDGREIVQTVPLNVGGRHTPDYDRSSIAIELQGPGELSETSNVGFKLKGTFAGPYILGSPLNNSRYGYWPLFPESQLNALLKIITILKKEYKIIDVVMREEISEHTVLPCGPAFPITQLRDQLVRKKVLKRSDRSLVLQETSRAVQLLGQPDKEEKANTLLSEIRLRKGTPVFVINEKFEWYLIAVMAKVKGNPWLMGWVEKDAVRVNTDFIPVVNEEHFLVTDDKRRFPHIPPHKNGYETRDPMDLEKPPKFIIMHYTTGTKMESTINHFKSPGSLVSTHLLIGRDGRVVQFLPFNLRAHHAGLSWWEQKKHLNNLSIGIEIDNAGRLKRRIVDGREVWMSRKIVIPDENVVFAPHWKNKRKVIAWEKFPEIQLEVAWKIVNALKDRYPGIKEILGHDQVNLLNREDPGPLFPMQAWRKELFGREQPLIKKFYLGKETEIFSNLTGTVPNEGTTLHNPSILPADSEVIVKGDFKPDSTWTQIAVQQAGNAKSLRNAKGWVRTSSLTTKTEEVKVKKDNKKKKGKKDKPGNRPGRLKTTTVSAQEFYKLGSGEPTPKLSPGRFMQGVRVRKQEVRGKWTLVVVLDSINGQTGFEGWVKSRLVSEKPVTKPPLLLSSGGFWQHKDDRELGVDAPERPNGLVPAVFRLADGPVVVTKQWQFFIRAINYEMSLADLAALFAHDAGFCDRDENDLRADHLQDQNLDRPNPEFDMVRTCALSMMIGKVKGKELIVQMMDGSQPPPLKPGHEYPERVDEINPEAYKFTPWTHRHLFFAANLTRKGGKRITPFPNGAISDFTFDGRRYTWLPHVALPHVEVRCPLSHLVRLEAKTPIPSPYRP